MFAVFLNYVLSLAVVLLAFGLAWGATRLGSWQARRLGGDAPRPLMFLAATAFLLVAGIGRVGMTQPWSSGSVAATIDQGVFLALVVAGTSLLVLDHLVGRPGK